MPASTVYNPTNADLAAAQALHDDLVAQLARGEFDPGRHLVAYQPASDIYELLEEARRDARMIVELERDSIQVTIPDDRDEDAWAEDNEPTHTASTPILRADLETIAHVYGLDRLADGHRDLAAELGIDW